MNGLIIFILLCIVVYTIINLVIKDRAYRLLKIIYRLIYFEKRQVFFLFSQTDNSELHDMKWGKDVFINNKYKISNVFNEKNTKFYSIVSTVNSNIFTYNEYLILCDKFTDYINKYTNFIETDEFKKNMILLNNQRRIFDYEYLFVETEIFEDYFNFCGFNFSPTKIEIEKLLKYLKVHLYITNEYNIQLTERANKSLNLPVNLDDNFKNIIDKMISNIK